MKPAFTPSDSQVPEENVQQQQLKSAFAVVKGNHQHGIDEHSGHNTGTSVTNYYGARFLEIL
jgi:hypothetical protein